MNDDIAHIPTDYIIHFTEQSLVYNTTLCF